MASVFLALELLCFGGYPKVPFLGVPIGLFLIAFFWKEYFRIVRRYSRAALLPCFLFLIYMTGIFLLKDDSGQMDLSFIATLFYKMFANVCMAAVLIKIIDKSPRVLLFYTVLQVLLIFSSAFNREIFDFLLLFQSQETSNVFDEVFGLRAIGFGVLHNEGVVLLVLLYILSTLTVRSRLFVFINGALIYFSSLSSRLVVPLMFITQFLVERKHLYIVVLAMVAVVIGVGAQEDGPWGEVFELLNRPESIRSVDAIAEMNMFPKIDDVPGWLIGYGRFFGENGFYMDTDIGLSRILFAGGLLGVIIYIWANFGVVLSELRQIVKNKKYIEITIASAAIFFCF